MGPKKLIFVFFFILQSSYNLAFGSSDTIVVNKILNTVKGCWSVPMGLPATEKNLIVKIKLILRSDGSVAKSEIIDLQRMNKPGQGFYKVLAESALRAVRLCSPYNVQVANNQEILLKFDARNILLGTPSIEENKTNTAENNTEVTKQKVTKDENTKLEEEKIKSDCNVKKFKDILNCNLPTVVDVCDEWQRVYVKSFQRINFTKQPNNKFLMYPLDNCKSTFGGIFGMGTSVYASYKWDIKKHEFKDHRISNLLEKREKVNMVLISLSDHTNDKMKELYNYLDNNYKSSGHINKVSEVNSGEKNFSLWTFNESEILLICKRNMTDRCSFYLAYVHPELVTEILNSFIETNETKSQL